MLPKTRGEQTGKTLGKGVCSHNLPDPLDTHKPAQTLLVRRKQPGVCDVGWVHPSVPQKVIPRRTPQPPEPFARTSPRDRPPPLVWAPRCSTGLGRSRRLLPGLPLRRPARAAARASGAAQAEGAPGWLSYRPSRAGWQGPLEVRAQPVTRDQGSLPQHALQGGASEEPLFPPSPGETPLRSPDSRAGAAAPSLPQPQRWCAHPQPGPRLWLSRAQTVLCLPGRMSPPHPRPSEPGPPDGAAPARRCTPTPPPAHACTPWTFYPLRGSRGRLAGPSEPWARLKLQRVGGGGGRAAPGAGHRPHGPP